MRYEPEVSFVAVGYHAVTGSADGGTSDPVPSRPKVTVKAVAFPVWDEKLRTMALRTIGYRWRCSCGKRGPIRRKRPEAMEEKRGHAETHA